MTVLSSGSILGDFKIENEIGRGGMGVVYRATQVSLGRPVALKVIAGALADQEGFRERFVRESRLAASLDHPNVIPVYAAGEDEGVLFIAMRFVDGTDMRSVLSAEGALEPMRAAGVVAQVAAALDAAHELGLVHRDVKPANVLIAAPRRRRARVPHGLRPDQAERLGQRPDRRGRVGRALDYVAPEQLRGNQVDGRADVYALGCVLYEALTGGVPFPREDDVAKLWAHISDPPPWALDAAPTRPACSPRWRSGRWRRTPTTASRTPARWAARRWRPCPASATPALAREWPPAGRASRPPGGDGGGGTAWRSRWRAAARARAPPPSRPGRRRSFLMPGAAERPARAGGSRSRQQRSWRRAPWSRWRLRWAAMRKKGAEGGNALAGAQGEVGEIVSEPIPVGDSPPTWLWAKAPYGLRTRR